MTSITLFGQDREMHAEKATAAATEMQSNFDLTDENTVQLTQLLEQVMNKADYVQNSGKIEGEDQQKAMREIRSHYEVTASGFVDESMWEEFIVYSTENFEFMK